LEATLAGRHDLAQGDPSQSGRLVGLEVRILRVHLDEELLLDGHQDRIDPQKWRPLIMSFCQFFGLGPMLHPSRLATIPESSYRTQPTAPPLREVRESPELIRTTR
jgi:hypothetical protein